MISGSPDELARKPKGWGEDDLSLFIEHAYLNSLASFVKHKDRFVKLAAVDCAYGRVTDGLDNVSSWFSALFAFRAHSSFRASCRLAVSGQAPEAYMVMRGCLENALYGWYLAVRPNLRDIWLARHKDESSFAAVKKGFKPSVMLSSLRENAPLVAAVATTLYNRTIDLGAHPNEQSLMQVLRISDHGSERRLHVDYLSSDQEVAFGLCIRSAAQVGICALDMLGLVFEDRFRLLGVDIELGRLKAGL